MSPKPPTVQIDASTPQSARATMHGEPWWRSFTNGLAMPFWGVHVLSIVGIFFVGFHWWTLPLFFGAYTLILFGITAGYHRYFAHRTYKTSRAFQFVLALFGTLAIQKGVLWWAAHHRHHHRASDTPDDIHSPVQGGFWWSHVGWILSTKYNDTNWNDIPDMASYPELRWLNKYFLIPEIVVGALIYFAGGLDALIWALFAVTCGWHGTFTINSLTHVFGKRRFDTTDDSRNNVWLALLTLGEGWHNNHHHYPGSTRQGFYWWEVDVSYYVLTVLSWLGIVWEMRAPPERVLEAGREADARGGAAPFELPSASV